MDKTIETIRECITLYTENKEVFDENEVNLQHLLDIVLNIRYYHENDDDEPELFPDDEEEPDIEE